MKNKKGLELNYLGWILISFGVLLLAAVIIILNKGVLSGILSRLKF